ncbi:hypothetical protein RM574_12050 [Streptomyces sp. DSM 41982]|uniref:Lipoprotein n=1 Tax=Streptomyces evansiae TaxID=3075535 RepID=A0ABD5E455_9ACTN|nr:MULTISPECIES: hypothetical protein [unclassified Streptomyces]MDT0416224.1 hypothetical protein [Streptomyces sp. DSM 41982]SCE27788.1 hypothetical protein GA0115246_113641 [Streptomyces sp. SolWspMP-sol7th]
MRPQRTGRAVLVGLTALAGSLPWPAAADGAPSPLTAEVRPATAIPGAQVRVSVRGCAGSTTVRSALFAPRTLAPGASALVTVSPEARHGTAYDLTFDCADGRQHRARLQVAAGGGEISETSRPRRRAEDTRPEADLGPGTGLRAEPDHAPSRAPDKGVRAGEGGGVSGTFSTGNLALGVLLVGGVLTYAYRRSRA